MASDLLQQNDEPSPAIEKQTALEGPFLHADDAAYWAHRHIGGERSVEYGGVILTKGGRFYASTPRKSQGKFARGDVVKLDGAGKMIFPDGYAPYAFYHSHPKSPQPAGIPTLMDEVWSLYLGMFSYTDMELIIENGATVPAHYLSGPNDGLIKYVVSGSIKERELIDRLQPERLKTFDFFTDYIPLVAGAGELSVVLANTSWSGKRGRVREDWQVGVPLKAEPLHPLFSKITDSPDLGDLLRSRPAPVYGYQLKSIGKEQYVVPVKEWENIWLPPPQNVFKQGPAGGVMLPSNFSIHAVYCRHGTPENWQQYHFFAQSVLALVAERLQASPEPYSREPRLRLVMLSGEGALLSYRFSGTDAETQFLGANGANVDNQLQDGRLTPRQYIDRMAGIGELEVLEVGRIWRTLGRFSPPVTPVPRANLVELLHAPMSPAFITADDAARYLHDRIRVRNEDLLGFVLQRNDDRFVSTPPIPEPELAKLVGSGDRRSLDSITLPPGYRAYGFFVANSLFDEAQLPPQSDETVRPQLSPGELAALSDAVPLLRSVAGMLRADQTMSALYHSSSLGSLVKYVRSGSRDESGFSGFLLEAVRAGEFKVQQDGFDGTPIEMVRKLARVGEFSVLVTSRVWGGSRGRVPANWAPFKPFVAASPAPPFYSWIFQDLPTAVQYGHDQLPLLAGNQPVAFILKALEAEQYVVALTDSEPTGQRRPMFSPLRVFARDAQGGPVLPGGYEIHGVCFASRPALGMKVEERWLYECFVAPDVLALAIATSREPNASLHALFFTTRDGAQLKYELTGTPLEGQLYGVSPTGIVNDNGTQAALVAGTLKPSEFVRRVAAAGRLSVRKVGTLWDVLGEVDQRWKPFAKYPPLAFSAPFLTADDAARFAHEQVVSQPYAQLCGFILQAADGRFVATLPQACHVDDRFVIAGVFTADHTGAPVVPAPYTLYGQYASCRALALMDKTRMNRYRWSRTEAATDWQLFSDVELRRIIDNRNTSSVAYLSSAEGALIAYEPSASAAEVALRAQLEPGPRGTALDTKRASAEFKPQDHVRQMAGTGLRIVQGNPLWGRAGELTEDWQAFAPAHAYERPERVAFGAVFSSAHAAAKDAHARLARGYASAQTAFGFVLKHTSKAEYVVSETVPQDGSNPLFNMASLFKTDDEGAFIYPAGFTLHGLFYARQWMPETVPGAQRWLARHFLSSSDLYDAFFEAKRRRESGARVTLPLYISTLDHALLHFQSPISTLLFDPVRQPSGVFEDVHTRLASGQLTAQGFVSEVAAKSWLTVVLPNECWDETGKLTAGWVPYADFSRRALSPAYLSMDDAVRYAKALVGQRQDRVYGGLVLQRLDGRYVATEPVPVATENFDPKWILPDEDVRFDFLAPGTTIVARYRSRQDTLPGFPLDTKELAVYRNMFSTEVLARALECTHLWRREYLFGPDGSVISFSCDDPDQDLLSQEQRTQQALTLQQLKQALAPSSQASHDPQSNPLQQQLHDGLKTPTEVVNLVLKAATMTVVQGSEGWGNARKLARGWLYAFGFTGPELHQHAIASRALSPVFNHIDDVARYAHEQAGARSEPQFGFILKSANGHWVASLPVNQLNTRFSPDQVFLRGQLPTGWTIQGLYLCAPARQPAELSDSPVYRSFIPPTLLSAALGALRRDTARDVGYLPLYLSCADGALLSYRATAIDSDWGSEQALRDYVNKLNGNFNPADYIRQVARAGELRVLITGQIWAAQGQVGSTWHPRQTVAYTPGDEERVALGPLFAHADDAARYQWRRYGHERDTPGLAAVLANAADNTFLVTEPLEDGGLSVGWGRSEGAASQRLFSRYINPDYLARHARYPHGYRIMGAQQLYKLTDNRERLADRYEQALADNFIGQPELSMFIGMFRNNDVAGARYYFTPRQGALLVYVPSYQKAETDLLFSGWIDPTSEKPVATPSQVITTLTHSGRLYILETDTFWQPRGHVATRLLQALRKEQPT